jgi:hypothetical protein
MRNQQPQRPQKPRWNGEEVSRRPRQFSGRRGEEPEFDWVPPSEKRRIEEHRLDPLPAPEVCKKCGQEVVWMIENLPGGGMRQVPHCERHGPVDLSPPPPADPNRCVECRQELVWELLDPHLSFQPVCPSCGPVHVHEPEVDPRAERPFAHQVSFNLSPAPPRARGLTERDVVGAIRLSRPQRGPRTVFLQPHEGPTRPS